MIVADNEALEFVENLGDELSRGELELPSFPDVAERTRRTLDNPDCSSKTLALVIGADATLAARVIRMANSAAYNSAGKPITELRGAIGRLGHETIRSTAVAHAVRQLSNSVEHRALREPLSKLWKHSVQVAAISHALAKRHSYLNADEALLAGLVHDIGKLYILKCAADRPTLFDNPTALDQLVQEWHTGVGRAIVEAWGFSEAVAMATDEHEVLDYTTDAGPDITCIVLVSNLLAKLQMHEIESVDFDQIPAFRRLGLGGGNSEEILRESAEEIRSIVDALKG